LGAKSFPPRLKVASATEGQKMKRGGTTKKGKNFGTGKWRRSYQRGIVNGLDCRTERPAEEKKSEMGGGDGKVKETREVGRGTRH